MMAATLRHFLFLLAFTAGVVDVAVAGIDIVRDKTTRYEDFSAQYATAALNRSQKPDLLLSYSNVDSKEQFCMVLIDLLGINPEESAQSVHPDPGLNSQDAEELARYSLSLRSYVDAARSLLEETDFSWKYKWNLNCSGVYGANKYINITDDPPFSVRMAEDGEALKVVGDIREGLFDSVAKRLAIHRSIKRVELSSSGGWIEDALKIGRLLRKRSITTVVDGNCHSSCALIFLGGIQRIVPPPYWDLGFHRASDKGTPLWDGDALYEKIRIFIDEMIGRGDELVRRSLMPSGLDLYRPSRKDLCWRNIATIVIGVCDASSEPEDISDGVKTDLN